MRARKKLYMSVIAVMTVFFTMALGAVALADNVSPDGDTVKAGNNITYQDPASPGQWACSARGTAVTGAVTVTYGGSTHFTAGEAVDVTLTSPNAGITVGYTATSVPSTWNTNGQTFNIPISTTTATSVAQGTYTITVDLAGHTSGYTPNEKSYTVTVGTTCTVTASDTTAPSITYSQSPDGSNGWFVTSPATVKVTATDPDDNISAITCTLDGSAVSLSDTSGIGSNTTAYGYVSTTAEGDHTVSCTATDSHTNTTDPAATTRLKLDTRAPTFTGTCGGSFLLNSNSGSQTVTMTATDPTPGSGLDSANSTLSGTVDTTAVGKTTLAFTAKDNAGSANSESCDYWVQYAFVGFTSPVDNPSVLNVAKAGQAIPLKWQLLDANNDPVTNLSSVTVTVTSLTCSLGTTTDLVEEVASGASGLQNLGGGYYQFNWKTPTSYAKSCKTMILNLGDGNTSHTALFQFTK